MSLETVTVYVGSRENTLVVPNGIRIFGFTISLYGVLLTLAAIIGIVVSVREAAKKGIDTENMICALQLVIVFSVIGGRLYYVLSEWSFFSKNLLSIVNLRTGGLSFFGALLFSWIALKLYCKKKKESFNKMADAMSMGVSLTAIPAWIGCIMTLTPTGRYTEGSMAVKIPTGMVENASKNPNLDFLLKHSVSVGDTSYVSMQPVALYGLLFSLLIFLALLLCKKKIKGDGNLFTLFLALTSGFSILTELFRVGDGIVLHTGFLSLNGLTAGILAVTVVVYSFFEGRKWLKKKKKNQERKNATLFLQKTK